LHFSGFILLTMKRLAIDGEPVAHGFMKQKVLTQFFLIAPLL